MAQAKALLHAACAASLSRHPCPSCFFPLLAPNIALCPRLPRASHPQAIDTSAQMWRRSQGRSKSLPSLPPDFADFCYELKGSRALGLTRSQLVTKMANRV